MIRPCLDLDLGPECQYGYRDHARTAVVTECPTMPTPGGPDVDPLAAAVGADYLAGASIRKLITAYGLSYGTVRKAILRAGVELRARGGRVDPGVRGGAR